LIKIQTERHPHTDTDNDLISLYEQHSQLS